MRKKGFTLIEFIIVIVILSVVSVIAGQMMFDSIQATHLQYNFSSMEGQARLALARMTRELREIRSNSATDLTIGPNEITFHDVSGGQIEYSVSGTTFMRNLQPIAYDLSGPIAGLVFAYYKDDGTVTALGTEVRYIGVELSLAKDGQTFLLNTMVEPRNFL